MNAPFTRPEIVWPDLAERIDRAFAAHGAAQQDPAALERALAAAVSDARAAGAPNLSWVPNLDADARTSFDGAFSTAERLFAAVGVPVPEAADFAAAGVDFAGLAGVLAADAAAANTLSLVPVLAPHGLGAEWWRERYVEFGGLVLAGDVIAEFRAFDSAPEGTRTGDIPVVVAPRAAVDSGHTAVGEIEWILRLVPAGAAPVHVNLNYRAGGAEHPSLPEMLALQAGRMSQGLAPVDAGVFTWLAGTTEDGKLAARHVWDAAEGAVRISCREIGNQGSYLGVRPPIAVPPAG